MTELSEAMSRLIEPWTLTITANNETRTQKFPPLVDMLTAMITPSSGGTVGGANDPASRSVVNITALDLLGNIQDITGAWLKEWGVTRAGETKLDLRGFWDRLDTLKRTGLIDDTMHDRLVVMPDKWAMRIWDQVEPPLARPLREAPCPDCGVDKVTNEDGSRDENLILTYRRGQEVTVECRNPECRKVWVGFGELRRLGASLGIVFNEDAFNEAVGEMEGATRE